MGAGGGLHRPENVEKQCKTVILVPKRPLQLSKFKFLNSEFEFQASSCITDRKYYIMKRLRSMGAGGGLHRRENVEKQCKTVILAPKRPLQLSKFNFFNSKFEFQASSCITNLKYYIYEASAGYGCRGGLHRRENVKKQCKTVQNGDFGAKTTVTAQNSKFLIQNLNFKPLLAILTPNITYMKRLGAGEASTDEKT